MSDGYTYAIVCLARRDPDVLGGVLKYGDEADCRGWLALMLESGASPETWRLARKPLPPQEWEILTEEASSSR